MALIEEAEASQISLEDMVNDLEEMQEILQGRIDEKEEDTE
jgi:hypothetical protein